MKKIFLIAFILASKMAIAQAKIVNDGQIIHKTIIDFLKWHKADGEEKDGEVYFVPRYDGKGDLKTYFDKDSLALYYKNFVATGFVSETYITQLKDYFGYYEKYIGKKPKEGELRKIDGLDQDIILGTFEPEVILDNLEKAKITKSLIVYNKALVGIHFTENVDMVFLLTKFKDKWLIDYVGPDNTKMYSVFRQ